MHKDGLRHFLLRILPYLSETGSADGAIVTFVNVTSVVDAEQKQRLAESHLARLAKFDPFTELPNGRALGAEFHRWQSEDSAVTKTASFSLIFIDLDRFKTINDSFGHLRPMRYWLKLHRGFAMWFLFTLSLLASAVMSFWYSGRAQNTIKPENWQTYHAGALNSRSCFEAGHITQRRVLA